MVLWILDWRKVYLEDHCLYTETAQLSNTKIYRDVLRICWMVDFAMMPNSDNRHGKLTIDDYENYENLLLLWVFGKLSILVYMHMF